MEDKDNDIDELDLDILYPFEIECVGKTYSVGLSEFQLIDKYNIKNLTD
jgi:hypothetical protein